MFRFATTTTRVQDTTAATQSIAPARRGDPPSRLCSLPLIVRILGLDATACDVDRCLDRMRERGALLFPFPGLLALRGGSVVHSAASSDFESTRPIRCVFTTSLSAYCVTSASATVLKKREDYKSKMTPIVGGRCPALLRLGNLVDEDRNERDRFGRSGDLPAAVPLPEGVARYAIGATTGKTAGDVSDRSIGDGIVPLASALGRHAKSESRPDVRRVAAVGDLWHQPPRSAQPTRSLRVDQAMARCLGLSVRFRHSNAAAARIRPVV